MMQEEMSTLRRAIRQLVEKMGLRRDYPISEAGRRLAVELGAPADVVSRILDRTAADLRELADTDEVPDARPIINRAINELAKYGYESLPFEEAAMERCLSELPEQDLTILCYFKQGKKHREIAGLMGIDVESVRRSLVNTYADLRMKMMSSGDGDGGGTVVAEEERRTAGLVL